MALNNTVYAKNNINLLKAKPRMGMLIKKKIHLQERGRKKIWSSEEKLAD